MSIHCFRVCNDHLLQAALHVTESSAHRKNRYKVPKNILTAVIKRGEGKGTVSQVLEEVRHVAPVPEEDLVRCRHGELLVKLPALLKNPTLTDCERAL